MPFSSQFEEKLEELNGAEPPAKFPLALSSKPNGVSTTVASADTVRREIEEIEPRPQAQLANEMSYELNGAQESGGGMMRIVPSYVDVSVFIRCSEFLQSSYIYNICL